VLRKFARDQALTNIELIKPYTDRFSTIVMFLVTGEDAAAATCATYAATYAIADDAAAAVTYAVTAATYAVAAAPAAADAAYAIAATSAVAATYAATYAAYAADAAADADYTKAIERLTVLANKYLALLECAE